MFFYVPVCAVQVDRLPVAEWILSEAATVQQLCEATIQCSGSRGTTWAVSQEPLQEHVLPRTLCMVHAYIDRAGRTQADAGTLPSP